MKFLGVRLPGSWLRGFGARAHRPEPREIAQTGQQWDNQSSDETFARVCRQVERVPAGSWVPSPVREGRRDSSRSHCQRAGAGAGVKSQGPRVRRLRAALQRWRASGRAALGPGKARSRDCGINPARTAPQKQFNRNKRNESCVNQHCGAVMPPGTRRPRAVSGRDSIIWMPRFATGLKPTVETRVLGLTP